MVSRNNTIQIVINAKDNASAVFGELANNTQEVGKVITGAFAVAATSIAASAGVAVTKGLQEFQRFETGMNEVFTLLPGISQDAMDSMSSQVQSFSARMGVLSEDVVPALYQSLSAGVPQDNVFQFLETAQKAALGGVTDLETAVDGISSVMNAYGSDVLSATEASDLMFTAVRLGKTDFEQLSSSLFNVAPIAASMGIEFENVTAALATLTAQGVPTSVAATQLRSAFTELADSGSEVGKAFQETAGKSFRDFIAEGGNMADALAVVQQAAHDTGKPIDELFGSVEAAQAVLGLTGANAESFRNALEEMGASAGATDVAFNQMNQGIGRALDRLRATAQNFFVNLGKLAAPLVTPFIKGFSDLTQILAGLLGGEFGLENFADTLAEIPPAFRPLLRILAPIATGFRQLATDLDPNNPDGFFGALNAGIPLFGVVIREFRRVSKAMGFSNDVVDSATNAIITFWQGLQTAIGWVKRIVSPIMDWFKANVDLQDVLIATGIAISSFLIPTLISIAAPIAGLVATFGLLVAGVAKLRKAWENNFLGIKSIAEKVNLAITNSFAWFRFVRDNGGSVFDALIGAFQTFIGEITYIDWGALGQTILNGLGSALSGIGNLAKNAVNAIMPMIANIGSAIANTDWSGIASSMLSGIGQGLASAATTVSNFVTPIIDSLVSTFQSIDWGQVASVMLNALGAAILAWANWVSFITDNVLNPIFDTMKNVIGSVNWQELGSNIVGLIFSPFSGSGGGGANSSGVDWGNVFSTFMNAIGNAAKSMFNFMTWAVENVTIPLLSGIVDGLSNVDWGQVWTTLVDLLSMALSTVVDWATWAYDNIINPIFNNAKTAIESIDWGQVGYDLITAIGNGIMAVVDFVQWIVDFIFNPVTENAEGATSGVDWGTVGTAIMNAIGAFFSGVFNFISWVSETIILPLIAGGIAAISTVDWSGIGQGIMDAIGNAIPNIAEWVNNHIIQPIKNALSGFNPLGDVQLPDVGGALSQGASNVGGFFSNVGGALGGLFKKNQFGGQVTAGVPTKVGEGGSEIFVPDTNGQILNAQDTAAIGSGGQPVNITFVFNRGISDNEARESASKLKRELQAQGIQVAGTF